MAAVATAFRDSATCTTIETITTMPSSEVLLTPQTLEGNIAGETETDQEFGPKFGRRSRGARKDDALTSDGLEFADGTENGRYRSGGH